MKYLVVLFIVFSTSSFSSNRPSIERGGSGCPDNFCVWLLGKQFGANPVVYIHNKGEYVSRYYFKELTQSYENGDALTFVLKSSLEMDLFESEGLTFSVLNTENKTFSNSILIKRSGPPSIRVPQKSAELPLEIGGVNYVMYDLGGYLEDQSLWGDRIRGVKMLIARYHENPDLVNEHIRQIAESGQKIISLVFWYVNYPGVLDNIHMHTVNISSGIPDQQIQNIINILNEIKKYNFSKVILRMAPQGQEIPSSWQSWNESNYQIQWRAIDRMISLVNENLRESDVTPLYDLSAEGGGITEGLALDFNVRLWRDYIAKYGNRNALSFSVAYYPGRISAMVDSFDRAGLPRPNTYALDIYGPKDDDASFYRLAKEMIEIGEMDKPILLQETYYNDAKIMQVVNKARSLFGLNIIAIIQWNLTRSGDLNGDRHFSLVDPSQYAAYKTLAEKPEIINIRKNGDSCFVFRVKAKRGVELKIFDFWGENKFLEKHTLNFEENLVCLLNSNTVVELQSGGLTFVLEEDYGNQSKEFIYKN